MAEAEGFVAWRVMFWAESSPQGILTLTAACLLLLPKRFPALSYFPFVGARLATAEAARAPWEAGAVGIWMEGKRGCFSIVVAIWTYELLTAHVRRSETGSVDPKGLGEKQLIAEGSAFHFHIVN